MFARRPVEEPRIEISSLVDVVFLLLIFFMVTTRFTEQQVVDVQLPSAEGESRELQQEVPELVVDATGRIFVDGAEVAEADLRERLEARFAGLEGAERVARGRIDGDARFDVVLKVFDACSRLGIQQVLTLTEPKERAGRAEEEDGE
jgi:biopolymer transport protein ExbD